MFIFDHLDGMYSYCYSEKDEKRVIHLSTRTPLNNLGDYHIIRPQTPKKISLKITT